MAVKRLVMVLPWRQRTDVPGIEVPGAAAIADEFLQHPFYTHVHTPYMHRTQEDVKLPNQTANKGGSGALAFQMFHKSVNKNLLEGCLHSWNRDKDGPGSCPHESD